MPDEPEVVTGPPIETPEGHVHEEYTETPAEGSEETADEVESDIADLAEQLVGQAAISETRHNAILNEVTQCREQITLLSQTNQPENPLLTQLLNQMIEI